MLDLNWGDPTVATGLMTGASALGGGVGFGIKSLLDWRAGRAQEALEHTRQQDAVEEKIRADLQQQIRDQRDEIITLRGELAQARAELREFTRLHQDAIKLWQDRYEKLLIEVAELRGRLASTPPHIPA